MPRTVLHLGGNGHASTRLIGARRALSRPFPGLELVDVPYPGFEGRPRAGSLEAFLESLSRSCRDLPGAPACAYASGIGALLALGLRARGDLVGVPLIFQGPVLWGLEHRWFPRAMRRFPPARGLLRLAFRSPRFQARFARKQFERPHEPETLRPFFEGYGRCTAFGDLFDWLTPGWLRTLERSFLERPEALGEVRVWIGGRDHVVGLEEVRTTERALKITWPVEVFETWGHYPMIDVPEEWADALRLALDPAGSVR